MAKVRIDLDVDHFDEIFGTAELIRRFEGIETATHASDDNSIPTLDLTGMEIVPVEGEIEEVELSALQIEAVDDSDP